MCFVYVRLQCIIDMSALDSCNTYVGLTLEPWEAGQVLCISAACVSFLIVAGLCIATQTDVLRNVLCIHDISVVVCPNG